MKKLCMILPLALILCFMVGCQDKEAMAELEAMKAQKESEEQNMAFVRSVFDGLNKQNEAVYKEFYASEYGWYFPANSPKALTREEETGFVKLLWAAFPDIRWEIVEMIASGDTSAVANQDRPHHRVRCGAPASPRREPNRSAHPAGILTHIGASSAHVAALRSRPARPGTLRSCESSNTPT